MLVQNNNIVKQAIATTHANANTNKGIFDFYLDFCDRQMKYQLMWFLIPLVTLAFAIMPAAFIVMVHTEATMLLAFTGIAMLLFFANVIAAVAGLNTRATITLFILTVLFNFLVPLVTALGWITVL